MGQRYRSRARGVEQARKLTPLSTIPKRSCSIKTAGMMREPVEGPIVDDPNRTEATMGFGRGLLLWLIGIPLPIIILLALFWR